MCGAGDWTGLGSQKERIRLQCMARARPELLDATTNPGLPGGGPRGVQWMREVLVPESVRDGYGDKGSQLAFVRAAEIGWLLQAKSSEMTAMLARCVWGWTTIATSLSR